MCGKSVNTTECFLCVQCVFFLELVYGGCAGAGPAVSFLYLFSPIFSNNLKREIVQHPSKYHLTRNFRRNLQFKTKSKDFLAIGKIFENKISSLEFMRALLKHECASVLKVICFSCIQMSSEDKSSCALGGVS